MKESITYFDSGGKENTDAVLSLAGQRARARGVSTVVLASTTGYTARQAVEAFADDGIRLVVVPHQVGFDEPDRFPHGMTETLEDAGHTVHRGTMLFHTDEFYGHRTPTAMANILRCFCHGVKVCFEIAFMAVDGGCVEPGEKVILVAGTGAGADTALYATVASSQNPRRFNVHEIICMPR